MGVKHGTLHYGNRIDGAYENRLLKKVTGLTGEEVTADRKRRA
jgi:hypothetical protein